MPETKELDKDPDAETEELETELDEEVEPEKTDPKAPAKPEEPVDDNDDFFKAVLELDPDSKDLVGKYKSASDYIRGMHEAARLVGRRNEDAELGKALRGREKDFVEFLNSKSQPPTVKTETQALPTLPEYELLQAQVLDPRTGELRSDARPEDVQRFRGVQKELNRRIIEIAFHPEKALRQVFDQVQSRSAEEVGERLATERAVADFLKANGKWYWADASAQTRSNRGQEFYEYVEEAAHKGLQTAADQLAWAKWRLQEKHGVEAVEARPPVTTAAARAKRNSRPAEVDLENDDMPFAERVRLGIAAGLTEI